MFIGVLYFLLLGKVLGIFFSYQAFSPDRFPPETFVGKFSYQIYLFILHFFYLLNGKIRVFPSNLVTLMESLSAKIFFLRFPWILADLIIVLLAISFLKKKKVWLSLLFLNLNFWFFYYFDVQGIPFREKIYFYFLKPYKLSSLDIKVITCALIIIMVSFLVMIIKKTGKVWIGKWPREITPKNIFIVLPVLGLLFLTFLLGVFVHLSPTNEASWQAYFVSPKGDIEKENLYFIYEKKFNLLFKPEKAVVFSFCQSDYRLFINGSFVGQGGLISGQAMTYYDYWQADKFLQAGENEILIECYNPYLDTLSLVKKKNGLIFQLEAQKGIFKKRVVSDGSWKAVTDRRYKEKTEFVSTTSGFQEYFDETVNNPIFEKVLVIDPPPVVPWNEMVMRPIPSLENTSVVPLKIISVGKFTRNPKFDSPDLAVVLGNGFKEELKEPGFKELPAIIEKKDTFLIFDFGKIIVGYPKVTLSGNGGIASFGFAETLKTDGFPDIAKMVSQADQIKFGPNEFSYLWRQRRAFRYAMVVFDSSSPIDFKSFSVETVNYPANDEESYFNSSDPLLNKIFSVAKYTAKIARQGNYEDCPHREKAQYVGDLRIVSLVSLYNYSDQRLTKKALWEFGLSAGDDGFINAVYPSGKKLIIPDYSMLWITATWDYYLYTGDKAFLKMLYPKLKDQIDAFKKFADRDGIIKEQTAWWIFIDQGDQELNFNKSISLNFFYIESLSNLSKIANALEYFQDEKKYLGLAKKVKDAINKNAFTLSKKLYDDCLSGQTACDHFSRQTNTLALLSGIVAKDEIEAIKNKLVNDKNLPVVITPYFNTFVVEALMGNYGQDQGLSLIKNYWGAMLEKGATTFWETYDPKTGKERASFGESLSHGWSSGPAYLLPKWILGITPLQPGFLSFSVKPFFADLKFAKGKMPVGEGKSIEVDWSVDKDFVMKLKYNFFAKAEVVLPYSEKKIFVNNLEIVDLLRDAPLVKFWLTEPGDYEIRIAD